MKKIVWGGLAITQASDSSKTNFGVVIDNNRIVEIGAKNDLVIRYPDAELTGGTGYLLLPSMVDSHDHHHSLSPVAFGIDDDMLESWLLGLKFQPAVNSYLVAAFQGLRLLGSGVTAVTYFHNPSDYLKIAEEAGPVIQGLRDAGLRVIYCPPFLDQNYLVYDGEDEFLSTLPKQYLDTAKNISKRVTLNLDAYQQIFIDLFHRYHDSEQHLVHILTNPDGGQWCSDKSILALEELAQQHNTRVQMHLLETRYQKYYAQRKWGKSFIRHLEDIGALGSWLTLAHMVHVDLEDLQLLAGRGVGIASNPSSNLRLQSGIAPLSRMKEAGVAVGIGLDSLGLDDDQDYLRELRLGRVLGNVHGGVDVPSLSSHDVLAFGTCDGAAISFGQDVPIGKLLPGYFADLLLIDFEAVKGLWFTPRADPFDVLLYRGRREHVKYVMVNGEWVLKEGSPCRLNQDEIRSEVIKAIESQENSDLWNNAGEVKKMAPYMRSYYAKWNPHR